jgi:hypothetical protein
VSVEQLLSDPGSKRGRTQRAVLDLLREHEASGGIPTNGRFVFYELEQRGLATKPQPDDTRRNRRRSLGWPPGQQDVTDALTHLREEAIIPWDWIVDEERRLFAWSYADTVADYLKDRLREATINPWGQMLPPLILCESKATAGVLAYDVAADYCCPIAGTKGQSRGFLITQVAPLLIDNDRAVRTLCDLDKSGADIEANSRRVLERAAGRSIDWVRLGMTQDQVDHANPPITPIWKVDGRTRQGHWAVEVESLGQAALVAMVRSQLDQLLPEPLEDVLRREKQQRQHWAAQLDP